MQMVMKHYIVMLLFTPTPLIDVLSFQPYDINLVVTSIVSTLCQFPHPQLHEFLLDHTLPIKEECSTPLRILKKV